MSRLTINLNADLGESFGAWHMGDDAALLQTINSANIACGFHAGDPTIMRQTVRLAKKNGVSIGAHPSFPDMQGFGRRLMHLSATDLEAAILYQVGALQAMAAAEGTRVTHVKPHGALNNLACVDTAVAASVVRAMQCLDPTLILLAPAHSELVRAAQASKLTVRHEVFADRAYLADGQLMPRAQTGAVLHDPQQCVEHVMQMIKSQAIVTPSGQCLPTRIDSICLHGDGAQATASARLIRQALIDANYELMPLDRLPD